MAVGLSIGILVQVLLAAVFTWILFKLFLIVRNIRRLHSAVANFHNLPKHWLLGTLPLILKLGMSNLLQYLVEQSKQHRKVLIFWRGFLFPLVFITHPKAAEDIFRSNLPKSRAFTEVYSHISPWLGDGLLIASGKRWQRNRKLLTPAFHFKVLQPYMRVYNESVEILLSKIEKIAGTEESFEVFDAMALCTLDVILRCAFSYEGNVQEEGNNHPYTQAVKRLSHLVIDRALKPHLYIRWIYYLTKDGQEFLRLCDYVHTFADEIIEKRQDQLKFNPEMIEKPHLDFLDILLAARDEKGNGFTKAEMRSEVHTFLFAGHDTTASGASWAMYALAKYPEIQEKVYLEVREVLGDNKTVEWSDLSKLNYTAMFVKEVLRMYPPVPIIGRQLSKPVVIDGVEFPAGINVAVFLYVMHHNPDVWENPEEFRPERFAQDNVSNTHFHSYVPFSAGPRNCIGQTLGFNEMRVILARIVNRFRLVLDTDHPMVLLPELILRAKHGIKLKFYPRT